MSVYYWTRIRQNYIIQLWMCVLQPESWCQFRYIAVQLRGGGSDRMEASDVQEWFVSVGVTSKEIDKLNQVNLEPKRSKLSCRLSRNDNSTLNS